MSQIGITRTQVTAVGLIGILAGLYLARFGLYATPTLIAAGLASLGLLARMRLPALVAAAIVGLGLGLWRGHAVQSRLSAYRGLVGHEIRFQAKVIDDSVYTYRSQLEFNVSDVYLLEPYRLGLPGVIKVRGFGAPSVRRGDVITVAGRLKSGYGSKQGFISFAAVEVVGRDYSMLERWRGRFFAGTYTSLPDPQASLGLGFLLGTRTLLPAALLLDLKATGLTHIIAVSGYNLTILVRIIRRLLGGASIYLTTLASLALILLFVGATGLSPSIARAAVVTLLSMAAWYYGRKLRPTVLLLAAAALTAAYNPLYLWYDLGWHLSFAAFFGVLVLAPLLRRRIFGQKQSKLLLQIVIETSSAQLMTLPLIALFFGQVSLVALIANVIVLPLIPMAMLATFIAGIAGALIPFFSGWFAWPASLLLKFIIDMTKIMADFPWALADVNFSYINLFFFYGIVGALIIILKHKTKLRLNAAEVIE